MALSRSLAIAGAVKFTRLQTFFQTSCFYATQKSSKRNHYDVLGVKPTDKSSVIKVTTG